MRAIYECNGAITPLVEELKENGYKYIIKAQDKFLSGWGGAENKKHVQIIACRTIEEKDKILRDLHNDNTMSYVNWHLLDKKNIYNFIRNKSYTIRNDWTRAFDTQEEKNRYMEGEM